MRGYFNKEKHVNWCVSFAYDNENFLPESNDWFTLIAHLPYSSHPQKLTKQTYESVKHTSPIVKYEETLVWGINPFCLGTVHGYAFVYQLIEQFKNTDYRVLVAKDSQKGILELCTEAFKDRLVFINNKDVVEALEFRFVVNTFHALVDHSTMNVVVPLFLRPKPTLCLAALKTTDTANVTGDGILNQQQVNQLNIPPRFVRVKPEDYSEIDWMSMVYNCEELFVGWNSCYFKAMMYLVPGHQCKKIHCLIVGPNYEVQFKQYGKEAVDYAQKCSIQTVFHIFNSRLAIEW